MHTLVSERARTTRLAGTVELQLYLWRVAAAVGEVMRVACDATVRRAAATVCTRACLQEL